MLYSDWLDPLGIQYLWGQHLPPHTFNIIQSLSYQALHRLLSAPAMSPLIQLDHTTIARISASFMSSFTVMSETAGGEDQRTGL